jgi:hypothetical protein
MPKPQQPELRRSDYGATSDDSAKIKASVQKQTSAEGTTCPFTTLSASRTSQTSMPSSNGQGKTAQPRPES